MANYILSGLMNAAKAVKTAKAAERVVPKIAAPQAEALRLAQQRAIQKGQSANPDARSLQQGFEHGWYHGSTGDITNFRPDLLGEATGAASAKKGFFFARDPQNPPAAMMQRTTDQSSIDMLKKLGIPDEEIAKLNTVSMQGHGAETASGYAQIGGSREYREATRKAKSAEKRKDWNEYEKQSQIAEDAEINRMNYLQSLTAKHGDARDAMLDSIQKTVFNKTLPQAESVLLDEKYKQLFPSGWYNFYNDAQFNNAKNQLTSMVGEKAAKPALQQIDKYQSVSNERRLAEHTQEGGNVMPVALSYKNPLVHDFGGNPYREQTYSDLVDKALANKNDALILKNTFDPGAGASKLIDVGVMFNPEQVRSKFAVFDPWRRDAATAAALGVAAPDLLAKEKAKGGEVSQDAMRMALWKHPVKREAGGEANPTPEEMKASRLISQKRRGAPIDTSGAEALGTMLSGLGAAIPAGYAGLVELARTRDPKMAAEATEDLQRRYMALPTDQKTGDKVEGMAKFLEPLSKPAQYMGEKALGLFGPEVATATEVFLDPLNALPLIGKVPAAAKAVGRTLGPTADKMVMELMQKQGLAPGVVPKGLSGLSRQEFAMDTLYPGRDFESLVSAEKSAVKRYAGALETPAVVRRETTSGPTIATPNIVMSSPKIVTPEYFKEGRPMVPFVGDTSGGGYDLSQIAGIPLSQNVPVQAGFMYPFIQKAAKRQGVFASMKGMADKKLDNLLEAAEKTGENPYGSFSAMGPESINFSTPVAESIITQLPYLQLSKKALNEFNRAIKLPSAGYLAQPNFLGVGHPDIISQLRGVNGFPIKGAGELRKKIIDLASSAKFRNMGFPHYEDIADAIIHPDLVGAPRGLTGSAIFETNPSKGLITDPKEVAHFSYDSGYHGSRPVQLKHNVPSRVWYKDIYEKGMKEGFPQIAIDPKTGRTKDQRPLTADEVTGALMMRKDLFQPTNAEWLDHVMGYLRKTHPNAGYKKGGVIKAAEGGEITSDDLIVDERPL